MAKRKRLSLGQRLQNMYSWIIHPGFLIAFVCFLGLFSLVVSLAFPCGKYANPIEGYCDNGTTFITPIEALVGGGVAALVLILLIGSSEKNDPANNKGILQGFKKDILNSGAVWKKSRRKYKIIVLFLCAYGICTAAAYLWYQGAGLYWYNYIAIYGVIVPMFASVLTGVAVNMLKQLMK